LEEQTQQSYIITAIDDSESVLIFDSEKINQNGRPLQSCKINSFKEIPPKIKQKDLFGLGYPYFICSYANRLAFSSDYGIFVFEI
jgi:hypothetical protein